MAVVMEQKLTKFEKEEIARIQRECAEVREWESFVETYLDELVDALSRAEKVNFIARVFGGIFEIRDFSWDGDFKFPIRLKKELRDFSLKHAFEYFLYRIELAEERQNEAKRKEELKQTALRKLTAEEKEALGF
jgi:hypothetical protein